MKETRYCPNCATEMQTISKSARKIMNKILKKELNYFWRCPDCGVREEADEAPDSLIIKTNDNGTKSTGYYDSSEDNIIYDYIQQKQSSEGTRD